MGGVVDLITRIISYIILAVANVLMRFIELIFIIFRRVNSRFVKFTKSLQNRLGAAFSKSSRNRVGMMVVYAGLTRNPEEILGIVLIYSIMLSAATTFIALALGPPAYAGLSPTVILILSAIVPFLTIWIVFYLLFIILMERRTGSIEKVLPDVLTIISQNMIAGMTVYNSLWIAARPEFGPLAVEIQSVARETLSGESFEKSLMDMSNRIKSYKLSRSVKLMIQGMRSGGELPTVLQEIATDIRAEQNLFKKMSSETTSQALFIVFALLVGAPLLFASSLQFVTIFSDIYDRINIDDASTTMPTDTGMVKLQKLPITEEFFSTYANITLIVSAIFGALLIGLIRTGKISTGVPLVPVLVILAVAIFYAIDTLLGSFFQGMMSI
ncbi:MAG: type II secretion system F family protein [Candidatus Altiarchaeota archaeon]|nr:type II secretion system F family protein [Candidatus Altiarchaeota archaeon]